MTLGRTSQHPSDCRRGYYESGFFIDIGNTSMIIERLPKGLARSDWPRVEARYPIFVVTMRLFGIRAAVFVQRRRRYRGPIGRGYNADGSQA